MAKRMTRLMEKKGDDVPIAVGTGEKPVSIRIAYIGGGSRGWAHALIKDLLMHPGLCGEVRLYDIDKPMAAAMKCSEHKGCWGVSTPP
jgi:hypothetical protein